MRTRRFHSLHHRGFVRGLHVIIDEARFEAALAAFEAAFPGDPRRAARNLVDALVAPVVASEGKPSWTESTPLNVIGTAVLLELYPDARVIDMVRDGRDSAVSKMRQGLQVPDVYAAMDWWANKMLGAHRSSQRAGDRVMVIHMEDLVMHAREETYAALLDLLGVDDDATMRGYFDGAVRPESASIGRWRSYIPPEEHDRFDAYYRDTVARLRDQGVACIRDP